MLNYNVCKLIYPTEIRTLKEINADCSEPVSSEQLVLQSIKMQPQTPTAKVESISGLASSTVSKMLRILQDKGLITKDLRQGDATNGLTAYFTAV